MSVAMASPGSAASRRRSSGRSPAAAALHMVGNPSGCSILRPEEASKRAGVQPGSLGWAGKPQRRCSLLRTWALLPALADGTKSTVTACAPGRLDLEGPGGSYRATGVDQACRGTWQEAPLGHERPAVCWPSKNLSSSPRCLSAAAQAAEPSPVLALRPPLPYESFIVITTKLRCNSLRLSRRCWRRAVRAAVGPKAGSGAAAALQLRHLVSARLCCIVWPLCMMDSTCLKTVQKVYSLCIPPEAAPALLALRWRKRWRSCGGRAQ